MSDFIPLVFPPWIKWRQRRGASLRDAPKGACAWCGGGLPKRRRSWCSDGCSASAYRVLFWESLCGYIKHRDGYTCRKCGVQQTNFEAWAGRGPWEVDHIVPVKDGGTDDPENLRLLCHVCHVEVGYEQRQARKTNAA